MGVRAFGTFLKRGDGGGPEIFTTIAEVKNISGVPGYSVDTADTTNHDSTSAVATMVATILRQKECTFSGNWLPGSSNTHAYTAGTATSFIGDGRNFTLRNFQLVVAGGQSKTYAFAAYVTDFSVTTNFDGVLEFEATLTPSGTITES